MTPENDNANDVADAYDLWSRTYDTDSNATRDLDAWVVRQQVIPLEGARVLELGCGTGKNTEWLAGRAGEVVALDLSDGMLGKARERLAKAPNVRFQKHDLRLPWPVQPSSQDVVIGNLVLEHIETLTPIFQHAFTALRRGGRLFLCELHPFRQRRGAQAHFLREDTKTIQPVTAFVHDVSDYLNSGLTAGLTLEQVGEWGDPGAEPGALPRLFSMLWSKR